MLANSGSPKNKKGIASQPMLLTVVSKSSKSSFLELPNLNVHVLISLTHCMKDRIKFTLITFGKHIHL